MIRDEIERRFGDAAVINYLDVADPDVESAHADMIREIETRGLLYPVTVVNGVPTYDGAVSYPGIMRSVRSALEQLASA